jgi:hypothetical protein
VKNSVAPLLVHHIHERLAVYEAPDVFLDGAGHALVVVIRTFGDMRSTNDVV